MTESALWAHCLNLLFYMNKMICVLEWKCLLCIFDLFRWNFKQRNWSWKIHWGKFWTKGSKQKLRGRTKCSQLRDHVHSLSMNQTGLQDAPDGDVRGSSLFQGTGNFFRLLILRIVYYCGNVWLWQSFIRF